MRIGFPLTRFVLSILALGELVLGAPAIAAEPDFRLTTGMVEPWTNSAGTGFHQMLIRDLFQRRGLKAELDVNLASARAFKLADDGVTDGLAGRVAGMEKEFPNLVAIPERMFVNDFVACGLPGTSLPANWGDLGPRAVAHIIGWQVFEHNLPKVRDLSTVKDSSQLLALLRSGHTELILHERWQAMWQAQRQGLKLVCTDAPLARTPMFIYLNRRHGALVEPLAQTLRAMKADGSYDAIARTAFGDLGASTTGLK
ncbi:hypothetical protein A6A04_10020 [Paramagnetospirillum marisnigri]|uniref:Uncharacterized protein n=1 Tax=Paramagnetospirillum marisnigri TaxID=1285242 RepID=A0A178M456_9PROT|nr:transporter substrate-binding domain-containing protein [Paramagnetospirillum marisnigri]OAN43022.1 hypothetical protein A6A04_10020 [Paramagnetospirillum marisnigri]